MAQIEINGKAVTAEAGQTIIEAADSLGIWIPRFCYHKKLSIAANCRMCLVDVEKAPKPLPACATPISDGMKIWTNSTKAIDSQKSVMEFLLINHPLDCPICDQGGECELQDLSVGYGSDVSRFNLGKRVIEDKDIGPLIQTDMTRCIQCTRCVRFGTEVAGVRELGATGRGEAMEIGTFVERSVDSEVSGNVIDLCPVGALTSKPFRYEARGWELKQTPSIAPHDCVGSHIYIHSRREKVLRVVPRENENLNEVWISDRDRFSYQGLYEDRLTHPKIKKQGNWEIVSWKEALETVAAELQNAVAEQGANQLAGLLSPNTTVEEGYLLQNWLRALGSQNIDYRLRQVDFRKDKLDTAHENSERKIIEGLLPLNLHELEHQQAIILVGSDLRNEQPILNLKLRKLTLNHGSVFAINPIDFTFTFELAGKSIVESGNLVLGLTKLIKALCEEFEAQDFRSHQISSQISAEFRKILDETVVTENDRQMARSLKSVIVNQTQEASDSHNILILMGGLALTHPDAWLIENLSLTLALLLGGRLSKLTEGANALGLNIAGCLPAKSGLNAWESLKAKLKTYILFGIDPELDCADDRLVKEALNQAKLVIAFTPFENSVLNETAHILLPICPFTENAGTYVNAFGSWQSFRAAVHPFQESKPAWKILTILSQLSGLEQVDYQNEFAILQNVKSELDPNYLEKLTHAAQSLHQGLNLETGRSWPASYYAALKSAVKLDLPFLESRAQSVTVIKIAQCGLYAVDNLVRRASALQLTKIGSDRFARIAPSLAEKINLRSEDRVMIEYQGRELVLDVLLDERLPNGCVGLPAATEDTLGLGGPYVQLTIKAFA